MPYCSARMPTALRLHYTETKGLGWAVDQLWLDVLMALLTPISFVVCGEVVKVQDILAICNQV